MTLDDLLDVYFSKADPHLDEVSAARAGIRAVVEALRDEISVDPGVCYDCRDTRLLFNDILGGAGDQAAGGSVQDAATGSIMDAAPAADPSPAMCEWTDGGDVWNTPCMPPDELLTTETFKFCPSCGKPIVFKEAKP